MNKLEELLQSLKKEELIALIIDMSNGFEGLEDKILFQYLTFDEDGEIKKNKKYLAEITKKYGNGSRFVTWKQCENYTMEVAEILETAKSYSFDLNKPLVGIETAINVISQMIRSLNYMDDSNGSIGDIVNESLSLIGEICINTDDFDNKDKTKSFNKLLKEADKAVYNGWEEWRVEVISNCIYSCSNAKLREKLLQKLDKLVKGYSDDWGGEYSKERVLLIKFNIVNMYGNELEKKNFIEENLKYSAFREILINQYLDKNEYEEVLRVSEEGEVLDSKYRGLVDKWKKYKYLAYKNLNKIEEQKKLAKELFLSNSSEFYEELKKLYKEQWHVFYKELKDEFEEKKWNTTEYYANMLIKENDLAELLSFVANDVSYIEQYAQILINEYKDKVNEIYKLYIESMAYGANDRKKYKKVCKVIIRYRELYGEILTIRIIEDLKQKYNKKPAFIDELERINSKR